MKSLNRSVVLFLDNATSHKIEREYSNLKVIFLPTNTTSVLQPLDQGIIFTIKQNYRKHFLTRILNHIDDDCQPKEIAKSVTVLDACIWVSNCVKSINRKTVQRCFAKCGFPDENVDKTFQIAYDEELSNFIKLLPLPSENLMDPNDFIEMEEEVPTHEELDEDWESGIILEIQSDISSDQETEFLKTKEENKSISCRMCRESMNKVISFMQSMEGVKSETIEKAYSLQTEMEQLILKNKLSQRSIDSYFNK